MGCGDKTVIAQFDWCGEPHVNRFNWYIKLEQGGLGVWTRGYY